MAFFFFVFVALVALPSVSELVPLEAASSTSASLSSNLRAPSLSSFSERNFTLKLTLMNPSISSMSSSSRGCSIVVPSVYCTQSLFLFSDSPLTFPFHVGTFILGAAPSYAEPSSRM